LDAADPTAVRAAAAEACAAAEASMLPEGLAEAVCDAYAELVSLSGEACAVRSSAISEDGAGASFAGLYESYLNIRGSRSVLEAVRACYASLWSERAIRYRALKGIGGDAMAVV